MNTKTLLTVLFVLLAIFGLLYLFTKKDREVIRDDAIETNQEIGQLEDFYEEEGMVPEATTTDETVSEPETAPTTDETTETNSN